MYTHCEAGPAAAAAGLVDSATVSDSEPQLAAHSAGVRVGEQEAGPRAVLRRPYMYMHRMTGPEARPAPLQRDRGGEAAVVARVVVRRRRRRRRKEPAPAQPPDKLNPTLPPPPAAPPSAAARGPRARDPRRQRRRRRVGRRPKEGRRRRSAARTDP